MVGQQNMGLKLHLLSLQESTGSRMRQGLQKRKDSSREVTQLWDCTCCVMGIICYIFYVKMGEFGT